MPKFDIVLQLDEHEKAQIQGACDVKTFSAAIKAHEALAKDEIKGLSALLRDKVSTDQLEAAQLALPALRKLMESLADSEAKDQALQELSQAEGTLEALSTAQESLKELQQTTGGHGSNS
ncbi:hypothetical protein AB0331_13615 [Dietzia maris]|uniref:hypothetical protein n=1 Tax=Dietzia maris TaxID=37915 RepID=UPI00344BDD20